MTLAQAVVLGIVQGLTEFLPISSSAHLVMVPAALGWPAPPVEFDVLLHAASLIAVVAYFRLELLQLVSGVMRTGAERRLVGVLTLGTVPAVIVGVTLENQIAVVFERPSTVGLLLMGTALVLVAGETRARPRVEATTEHLRIVEDLSRTFDPARSLGVGIAQAASILPGFSRSGLTIGVALMFGTTRQQAARFSFLLSIPALVGAAIFKLPDLGEANLDIPMLIGGFVASLVASYAAVAGMIGYLQRRGLYPFAGYCFVVGLLGAAFLGR